MEWRLDKFLTQIPVGTRSQVKDMIKKGRVCVNGVHASKPELKVDPENDSITLDGKKLFYSQYAYYMLNKPAGVITATMDKKKETVLDLLDDKRKDLFPVGRLDIDTEGLLLITNDGKLAHRLLSPKKHVDKVYYAKVNGIVTEKDVEWFKRGVDIGDEKLTMPAVLEILSVHKEQKIQEEQWINGEKRAEQPEGDSEILLTIREGRFHQVKRMFHAAGKEVVYLKRIRFGTLTLDPLLKRGEYRKLTEEEVKQLC